MYFYFVLLKFVQFSRTNIIFQENPNTTLQNEMKNEEFDYTNT